MPCHGKKWEAGGALLSLYGWEGSLTENAQHGNAIADDPGTHSATNTALPGRRRQRRAVAGAVPSEARRSLVRAADLAAWADGLRGVPARAATHAGRRGRLPGHLPHAGP